MQNDPKVPRRRVSAAGLVAPARKPAPAPLAPPAHPVIAPERRSAATLTVPKKPTASLAPAPQIKSRNVARMERLRRLRDTLAPDLNRNELALALIEACILEGIRTEGDIVRTLYHLGFNNVHAATMLRKSAGSNPRLHRWEKGEDGRYRLLS